jgi:rubredoxin
MSDYYEKIKEKTVCTECGGKDMAFGYLFEKSGIVKTNTTVLGMSAFTGVGNMLLITCRACGFVAKSFVIKK